MTPEARESLQETGLSILSYTATFSIYGFFFGIFFVLWVLSIIRLLKRGFGTLFRNFMFAAIILTLLLNIGNIVSTVGALAVTIKGSLITRDSRTVNLVEAAPYRIMGQWVGQINILINDSIVLWRAWILYPDRRWVMLFPSLTFLASLGSAVGYFIFVSNISLVLSSAVHVSASGSSSQTPGIEDLFNIISIVMSFATNFLSTAAILLKLWAHRRRLGSFSVPLRQPLTPGQRMLLVLTESGLIFSALQLVDVIIVFTPITSVTQYTILDAINVIFYAVIPIFPLVMVLLVNNHSTIVETFGFSAVLRGNAADVEVASVHSSGTSSTENVRERNTPAQEDNNESSRASMAAELNTTEVREI